MADDRSRDVDLLNAVDAFKEMGAREGAKQERRRAAGIITELMAYYRGAGPDAPEECDRLLERARAYVAEAEGEE